MGPTDANRLAQMPPSIEVAAAASSGTTIPAQTQKSDKTTAPMGKINRAFDYTHLGRDGADYFATMVTDELAVKVPSLSQYLVP
jgi:lysophospholipase L1-like esterase